MGKSDDKTNVCRVLDQKKVVYVDLIKNGIM